MQCDVPSIDTQSSFEDLLAAMQTQQYWVRFFMRPCCPPSGESTARSLVEHLKSDIQARDDLSAEEQGVLKGIIDSRLDWYLGLPVRHTA